MNPTITLNDVYVAIAKGSMQRTTKDDWIGAEPDLSYLCAAWMSGMMPGHDSPGYIDTISSDYIQSIKRSSRDFNDPNYRIRTPGEVLEMIGRVIDESEIFDDSRGNTTDDESMRGRANDLREVVTLLREDEDNWSRATINLTAPRRTSVIDRHTLTNQWLMPTLPMMVLDRCVHSLDSHRKVMEERDPEHRDCSVDIYSRMKGLDDKLMQSIFKIVVHGAKTTGSQSPMDLAFTFSSAFFIAHVLKHGDIEQKRLVTSGSPTMITAMLAGPVVRQIVDPPDRISSRDEGTPMEFLYLANQLSVKEAEKLLRKRTSDLLDLIGEVAVLSAHLPSVNSSFMSACGDLLSSVLDR